ncbi:ABC transporter ATP-binding protein [Mannheimia haemolytica]|nr:MULTISPECIES: ABC transporter ATP-binding protein [Pasteurellaceae]MDE8034095.1 ABC transporter ATP-binding protein [Actinobacillus equuli subsp. equuli]MDG4947788.1 ABC transporter ATP-binding protein [Actinobacillus equuli subsp. haemolyticus]MDW0546702.1 ABC transporter ATP-binding protein [Mannheimia haemolytica]MDW0575321.1 ABC transporter ATP-binding protein [Mannheimia haemolytica]MDW0617910.1 ABC transporter ATP-binding protein [Mannheimia haemolytica]
MIQINSISYSVEQNRKLLSNISLNLSKGRLYGVIGHNGSGKSTLMRLLSGDITPTSGSILVDGLPLHQLSTKEAAKHIAYLPQRLPEAADFLVQELVALGRFPYQKWLQKPTEFDVQIVEQAMESTSVTQFAKQPVNSLSGGEKQRVWLAMCLAQQTPYLLLDEPLAALDIVYQVEVMQLIRKLVNEQGLTVIIIIHDINLASQFCDEIIALKQGELCIQGSVDEIMQEQKLLEIFGLKLHLFNHPAGLHKVAVL